MLDKAKVILSVPWHERCVSVEYTPARKGIVHKSLVHQWELRLAGLVETRNTHLEIGEPWWFDNSWTRQYSYGLSVELFRFRKLR